MRAAGRKQAGDGALFLLTNNRCDGAGEKLLVGLHVPTKPRGLVETGTGFRIGQIATEAELLQGIQHLLRLRIGKRDLAVLGDVHHVIPTAFRSNSLAISLSMLS